MKMKKDKFKETKIKLVMKLKNLSRDAAVAEIARMDAARRADAASQRGDERRGRRVKTSHALAPNDDGDLMMSAEEFFHG